MSIKRLALFLAIACVPLPAFAAGQGGGDRLVHEGVVAAPARDVWAAFTTEEGQESWMVAHSEMELKVGGLMRTHYDPKGAIGDPGTIENTIISYDPERMLSIRVTKAPEAFPFPNAVKSMWTVLYFEAVDPRSTRVRIVSSGFGDDEESQKMRAFFDRGNAITLEKLQERFAPKKSDEAAVRPDEEQLLELHRAGLEAHLDSNVEALLAHQGDGFVLLNRGEISRPSQKDQREFLGPYLAATKFEFYRDRIPPVVKVSRDGSLGWVMAQVEARGVQVTASGKRETLEFVVAWIELYERQNGQWKAIGNASSFKAPDAEAAAAE